MVLFCRGKIAAYHQPRFTTLGFLEFQDSYMYVCMRIGPMGKYRSILYRLYDIGVDGDDKINIQENIFSWRLESFACLFQL